MSGRKELATGSENTSSTASENSSRTSNDSSYSESEEFFSCDENENQEEILLQIEQLISLFNCSYHLTFENTKDNKLLISNSIPEQFANSYISLLNQLTNVPVNSFVVIPHEQTENENCVLSLKLSQFNSDIIQRMENHKTKQLNAITNLMIFFKVLGDIQGYWELRDNNIFFNVKEKTSLFEKEELHKITNADLEQAVKKTFALYCDSIELTSLEQIILNTSFENKNINARTHGELVTTYSYHLNVSLLFLVLFKINNNLLGNTFLEKIDYNQYVVQHNTKGAIILGKGANTQVYKASLLIDHEKNEVAMKKWHENSKKFNSYNDLKREVYTYSIIQSKINNSKAMDVNSVEGSQFVLKALGYIDTGLLNNGIYLFVELGDGVLSDFYKQKNAYTLAPHQKKSMILQTLMGINHLHHCDLIHCDIKSDNIIFQKEGDNINIKIADFGFMKHKYNEFCTGGSHVYSPLETLTSAIQNENTDIYATGITIMEMMLLCYIELIQPYCKLRSQKGDAITSLKNILTSRLKPTLLSVQAEIKQHLYEMTDLTPDNRPALVCSINFFKSLPVEKFDQIIEKQNSSLQIKS